MAEKKSGKPRTTEKPVSPENKAKAALDEYKKRMDNASATASESERESGQGQPFAPPNFGVMPPLPFSSSGMPPYPPPHHEAEETQKGTSTTAFENIGRLISLGVEFLSASFIGGRQLMEGFSGQGIHSPNAFGHEPQDYYPYHEGRYMPHSSYHDCCNPGVHNCD